VAHFAFSCTLLANLRTNVLKNKIGENKFMKNLMRMLVLAVMLTAAGFANGMSFAGPGEVPTVPPRAMA
jgi:hypothetical protein